MKQKIKWLSLGMILVFLLGLIPSPALAKDQINVLLIVDASGSMRDEVEGGVKMDIAKRVTKDLINSLDSDINVGLRSYGLGINKEEYQERIKNLSTEEAGKARKELLCETKLLFPIEKLEGKKDEMISAVEGMEAYGSTPIAKSLKAGLGDFTDETKEDQNFIILVSDGKETCDGDPVAEAKLLTESVFNSIFYIIGFDIEAETAETLKPIAEAGGGTYYTSENAEELDEVFETLHEEIETKAREARQARESSGRGLIFIIIGVVVVFLILIAVIILVIVKVSRRT